MTPERWEQVKALFDAALDQPLEARAAFLASACEDLDLRQEVASLLDASDEAGPVDRLANELAIPLSVAREAAHPPPSPTAPEAGHRIGPYRIVREIGRGGMGAVYLAERADGQFEQRVALKLARAELGSESLRLRFLDERRVLARLQHPGIARLLGGGLTDEGHPYFAMEYVEGACLDRYCDTQRLGVEQRLRLFGQVCEAVHHAHQHLVVHRDLKPSNILVAQHGVPRVKLLDFGIAKLLEEEVDAEAVTRTRTRVLTPEYAAPEQVRGEPVSTASDIYSLGVVLFELLTGHRPYEVRTLSPGELERVICETAPPRPSTVVTHVLGAGGDGQATTVTPETVSQARSTEPDTLARRLAGDLDTIVMKALEKEPARRYASAEAFFEDIQRHLDGLPVNARPPSAGYRARKFVQRNTLGVVLASLLLLALGVGLAGTAWQARIAGEERDAARREAATAAQVTDFMVEVFGASDPWENPDGAGGAEVTARELLEQATQRVDGLDGEPAVQAEVLHALGTVQYRLGLYEQAQPLLERSLAARRALWGNEHEEVIESLSSLSDVLYETGAYDQVEALDREALSLRRQLLGDMHPDVAQSLNNLAALLHARGEHQEAQAHLREALYVRRQLLGEVHPDLAETLGNLAVLLRVEGDHDESEALQREALAMYRSLHGDAHPTVATSLTNLAAVLRDKSEYDEAEALQREALAMNRRLLGEDHPYVATSLNNLAGLLHEAGSHDEAEPLHREALALRRRLLGTTHPDVAQSLSNLAGALRAGGAYDESERLYRQALAMYRSLLGENHLLTATVQYRLGQLLLDTERSAEAEPLLRRALGSQKETLGEGHAAIAATRVALGRSLTAVGRYEEAESFLEEARTFYQSDSADEHTQERETVREAFAALYAVWDKPERAAR